jgi:hypothetical protein
VKKKKKNIITLIVNIEIYNGTRKKGTPMINEIHSFLRYKPNKRKRVQPNLRAKKWAFSAGPVVNISYY